MRNRDEPSLAYHQGTDTFNLHGPHGEGLITLSVEGMKALIQEGQQMLLDRSLRRREWEKKPPLNDSADVSQQEGLLGDVQDATYAEGGVAALPAKESEVENNRNFQLS